MTTENGHSGDAVPEPGNIEFEGAFRKLAEIAERLEAGGLTLAEATAGYEEGMKLVQHCNHLLDSAELEITTLRENYQRPAASAPADDGDGPPPYDGDEPPPFDDEYEGEENLPF